MSWTPSMAKECYEAEDYVELRRYKTNRYIRVYLSDDPENCHMVTRVKLARGEVLEDRGGDRVTVIAPTGSGTDTWTYKTYSVKVEIYYGCEGKK